MLLANLSVHKDRNNNIIKKFKKIQKKNSNNNPQKFNFYKTIQKNTNECIQCLKKLQTAIRQSKTNTKFLIIKQKVYCKVINNTEKMDHLINDDHLQQKLILRKNKVKVLILKQFTILQLLFMKNQNTKFIKSYDYFIL